MPRDTIPYVAARLKDKQSRPLTAKGLAEFSGFKRKTLELIVDGIPNIADYLAYPDTEFEVSQFFKRNFKNHPELMSKTLVAALANPRIRNVVEKIIGEISWDLSKDEIVFKRYRGSKDYDLTVMRGMKPTLDMISKMPTDRMRRELTLSTVRKFQGQLGAVLSHKGVRQEAVKTIGQLLVRYKGMRPPLEDLANALQYKDSRIEVAKTLLMAAKYGINLAPIESKLQSALKYTDTTEGERRVIRETIALSRKQKDAEINFALTYSPI